MSPKGNEKPANRTKEGRFVKGMSGNPHGRPAVVRDFQERCRNFMTSEGWPLLAADARRPGHAGFEARKLICAYAYGQPKQTLDIGGSGVPVELVEVVKDVG